MRKNSFLRLASVLILAAFTCCGQDDGFRVVSINGAAAYIVAADGARQLTAAQNYPYGTLLKTGRGTTVDLEISPENVFRMMPRTQLTLAADTRDPRLKRLQLDSGQVRVTLDRLPPGHSLQVETPTAVCGALGTHFVVAFESKAEAPGTAHSRDFAVSCDKGAVFASSAFTIENERVTAQTFEAPEIKAGTSFNAVIHEGLENSFTDITVTDGSLDVRYGTNSAATFTLDADTQEDGNDSSRPGPVRLVGALEKSGSDVRVAAFEVKSGAVVCATEKKGWFGRRSIETSELDSENGAVLVVDNSIILENNVDELPVSEYLAAARNEGEIHSRVTDRRKLQTVTQADELELQMAARRASELRRRFEGRQAQRLLRQMRGAGSRMRR